jgi:DNA-damage-inducible protein D
VERGIVPEQLPPGEDIKKVERKMESEKKKLPKHVDSLSKEDDEKS